MNWNGIGASCGGPPPARVHPLPSIPDLSSPLTCPAPCLGAALQAVKLVIKVLSKTMDSTSLSPDKVELATLSRDEADGKVRRGGLAGRGRELVARPTLQLRSPSLICSLPPNQQWNELRCALPP